MPRSRIPHALLVLVGTLALAGCSGSDGKEIADVKACLKKLDLVVESVSKDKDVSSGVFAATDQSKPAGEDFTFALAAHVKSDAALKRFQDESREFAETAGDDLDFETGVDGRYAWAAGGTPDSKGVKAARACVKP